MLTTKRKTPTHQYLFKAMWGGTSLSFWIEAHNEAQAEKRAKRYVFLMEGGPTCIDLVMVTTK